MKSLRQGGTQISEAYAAVEDGELWLVNAYIAPYGPGQDLRSRREAPPQAAGAPARAGAPVERHPAPGMTLVPLSMYFNGRGIAKIRIGVAKGKKAHDKRQTEARRDWQRQKARLLRHHE